MQYMLLLNADSTVFMNMKPEEQQQAMGTYIAYTEALKKAKVFVAGDQLTPSTTASTVRVVNGKTQIKDGPFAETKEQLGGYYLIDVPDLDEALKWAAKCPGAQHGIVEVRAIWAR